MSIIKKLPKIYQNNINKPIKNNRESYYSLSPNQSLDIGQNSLDIDLILDGIFKSDHHAYNIPVIIQTSTKSYDTYLIARTNSYVLTLDQDKIKIEDIISIKRKNP